MTGAIEMTNSLSKAQYDLVSDKIIESYEAVPVFNDGDDKNLRGRFVACLLRTAGHDFMDYRLSAENEGGSDGCINLNDPDNMGIQSCLTGFKIPEVYDQVKTFISFADFLVVIGQVIAAHSSN